MSTATTTLWPTTAPTRAGRSARAASPGRPVSADGWQWTFQDEGEIIICPWHHWQFDVKTVASDRYAVPTYDLQVEDGEIHLLR